MTYIVFVYIGLIIATIFAFIMYLTKAKILLSLVGSLCWCVFSPLLFLVLRKKVKTKWIVLMTILSPFFVVVVILGIISAISLYNWYYRSRGCISETRIEKITGIENMPDFSIKEHKGGRMSFNGDFSDDFILEFDEVPSNDFYSELDTLDGWEKHGNKYFYQRVWGNGLDRFEPDEDCSDGFFDITITKGKKEFRITNGEW